MTVSSTVPGTATVQASGTVTVDGVQIAVATNGFGAHDIRNTKTWVDARISIGTTGTNPVGQAHTFTVLVEKNDGTGWSPAADVTLNSTTSFGSITGGTCGPTGSTNASGQCTIIVNSNSAGTATINAVGHGQRERCEHPGGDRTATARSTSATRRRGWRLRLRLRRLRLRPPPPPPPTIDLSITKTDSPDPLNVGEKLTYTLTIHNNGPSTATQVTVADSLPATVTYLSSSSTQGSCTGSGQVVRCAIGTMPSGATVTVTIVVRTLQPGTILNVTATVVGAEAETNTANNRARLRRSSLRHSGRRRRCARR